MAILFTLVTFLLFITITYLRSLPHEAQVVAASPPGTALSVPQMVNVGGTEVPKEYSFHPGHTWAAVEDNLRARVGLDSFAANLIGSIDRFELPGLNRWVRQGQKLCKVIVGETEVSLVSPIEGIVVATNLKLREDPGLAIRDPYGEGWLFTVQSPDLSLNLKNLLQGGLVAAWINSSAARLKAMAAGFAPAFAQDGGLPVSGLLTQVDPELRRQMIDEFFLG
jgi:glycine cleavage system H lipoate-binding protein